MASYPYGRVGSGEASLNAMEAKVALWSAKTYSPKIKALNITSILYRVETSDRGHFLVILVFK
jgi:hypothetical protein